MEIIHGDNQLQSRNHLNSLIGAYQEQKTEIIKLDGNTVGQTDFVQAVSSNSLFSAKKVVIIENLLARVKSQEKEQIMGKLLSTGNCEIILWERKEISQAILKKLAPRFNSRLFKTPVLLFKFLDSFYPENSYCLTYFKQVLQTVPQELLFYLLVKRVRQLIICRFGEENGLKLADWQLGKLKSQAKKFSASSLLDFYGQLLQIDFKAKTGNSVQDLSGLLFLAILEVL